MKSKINIALRFIWLILALVNGMLIKLYDSWFNLRGNVFAAAAYILINSLFCMIFALRIMNVLKGNYKLRVLYNIVKVYLIIGIIDTSFIVLDIFTGGVTLLRMMEFFIGA